jgi:hypothetical protein
MPVTMNEVLVVFQSHWIFQLDLLLPAALGDKGRSARKADTLDISQLYGPLQLVTLYCRQFQR